MYYDLPDIIIINLPEDLSGNDSHACCGPVAVHFPKKAICCSRESICFAFLILENVSKWKAVNQASAFVTYIHHLLSDEKTLLLEDLQH